MPLRWWGTTATDDDAITGLAAPMPAPVTRRPGKSTVQVESAWVWAMRKQPTATSNIPPPSR